MTKRYTEKDYQIDVGAAQLALLMDKLDLDTAMYLIAEAEIRFLYGVYEVPQEQVMERAKLNKAAFTKIRG